MKISIIYVCSKYLIFPFLLFRKALKLYKTEPQRNRKRRISNNCLAVKKAAKASKRKTNSRNHRNAKSKKIESIEMSRSLDKNGKNTNNTFKWRHPHHYATESRTQSLHPPKSKYSSEFETYPKNARFKHGSSRLPNSSSDRLCALAVNNESRTDRSFSLDISQLSKGNKEDLCSKSDTPCLEELKSLFAKMNLASPEPVTKEIAIPHDSDPCTNSHYYTDKRVIRENGKVIRSPRPKLRRRNSSVIESTGESDDNSSSTDVDDCLSELSAHCNKHVRFAAPIMIDPNPNSPSLSPSPEHFRHAVTTAFTEVRVNM